MQFSPTVPTQPTQTNAVNTTTNASGSVFSPSSAYLANHSSSEVDTVMQTYIKLNKLFFGIGVYLFLGIVSLVLVRYWVEPGAEAAFPHRSAEIVQMEQKLQARIIGLGKSDIQSNSIDVLVKQGDLSLSDSHLLSVNNLVRYEGFVVPNKTWLPMTEQLTQLDQNWLINTGSYGVEQIDRYLDYMLYTNFLPNPTTDPVLTGGELLSISGSLIDYFGMQCVLYPQLGSETICNYVVKTMISSLAIYDLAPHMQDILRIAPKIIATPNRDVFCAAVQDYLFISNDTQEPIKQVMEQCGNSYATIFADFSAFRVIKDQLSKQTVAPSVSSSKLLNAYKLVSVMHDIYHEINKANHINELRIKGYNEYIKTLLKNPHTIETFYFDVIARFNSTFLIPLLTKQSIVMKGAAASEYRKLLLELNELQLGNSNQGRVGLNQLISNKSIIQSPTTIEHESVQTDEKTLLELFKEFYDFANYHILDTKQTPKNTIQTLGRLRFDQSIGLSTNTPLTIDFIYKDKKFFAQSVQMSRHADLERRVNQNLAVQPLLIADLYDIILKNYKALQEGLPTQSVCDTFGALPDVLECTDSRLVIKKGGYTYNFDYQSTGIQQFSIDNPSYEQALKSQYGPTISVAKDPIKAIQLVLDYVPETTNTDTSSSTSVIGGMAEIQLQKNFDDLGAKITKISKTDNGIVIDFTLQQYNFTSVYEPTTQTLQGLLVNGNRIRNFVFSFLTISHDDKIVFSTDPKTFLLKFDPLTVKRVLQ